MIMEPGCTPGTFHTTRAQRHVHVHTPQANVHRRARRTGVFARAWFDNPGARAAGVSAFVRTGRVFASVRNAEAPRLSTASSQTGAAVIRQGPVGIGPGGVQSGRLCRTWLSRRIPLDRTAAACTAGNSTALAIGRACAFPVPGACASRIGARGAHTGPPVPPGACPYAGGMPQVPT